MFTLRYLLALLLLAACMEDKESTSIEELMGEWVIDEDVYWNGFPYETDRFRLYVGPDSRFITSGNMCEFAQQGVSSGSFDLRNGTVLVDDCNTEMIFYLNGDQLDVMRNCFEPCLLVFRRE